MTGIFELVEASTLGRSSGRPKGSRPDMWGAVVIIAQVCLDAGLQQLHDEYCSKGCKGFFAEKGLDKFRGQLKKHGVKLWSDDMPLDFHVRLRRKDAAGSGDGSGVPVNGPMSKDRILEIIEVLNYLRNGYAHNASRNQQEPPKALEGTLWVRSADGTGWSVQKPHAFSAIRAVEVVYRYIALSIWGYPTALSARHSLPQLFEDRVSDSFWRTSVKQDVEDLVGLLSSGKTQDLVALTDQIRTRLALRQLEPSTPRLFEGFGTRGEIWSDPFMT